MPPKVRVVVYSLRRGKLCIRCNISRSAHVSRDSLIAEYDTWYSPFLCGIAMHMKWDYHALSLNRRTSNEEMYAHRIPLGVNDSFGKVAAMTAFTQAIS